MAQLHGIPRHGSIPRISVNKLAEFIVAKPQRGKRIVYDAKQPAPPITTMYKEARESMTDFILGLKTRADILAEIKAYKNKQGTKPSQTNKYKSCALALEALLRIDFNPIKGNNFKKYDSRRKYLIIKGVEVSVAPDLIVEKAKAGSGSVGSLKLHIVQTNPLSVEAQSYVGVILQKFAEQYFSDTQIDASNKLCFSVDVFKGDIVVAPASYGRKMADIEAACEMIALIWPTV
jgi:hypothetical protein